MSVTLGRTPAKLKVTVSPGSDFNSGLRRNDDTPWPDTTEISLHFGGVEWLATLDGPEVRWHRSAAEVDAMLATRPRGAQLWYVDGATRILWAFGSLDRRP